MPPMFKELKARWPGEHVFQLCAPVLRTDTSGGRRKPTPVAGVDGAFIVEGVLSETECDELIALARDGMGFSTGEGECPSAVTSPTRPQTLPRARRIAD